MRRRIVLWSALGGCLIAAALLWLASREDDAADRPRVAAVPVVDAVPTAVLAPTAPAPAPTATAAAVAAAPATQVAGCRLVERGTLPPTGSFGHPFASHVHVSYWNAGAAEERDVMLAGGIWQPEERVAGGRYRVYAGCSDREVRRKILIYQRQINREEPGFNAGWGDPRAFDWVAADG